MEFRTRTLIQASPERVWDVLVDLGAWPSWNSTVTATERAVAPGGKITVTVTANPGRRFPVTVTEMSAPSRMTWASGIPLGLFRGTRTFTLTPENVSTAFAMREVYSGALAPLITRSIPDLQESFDEFAACLKTHVESIVTAE
jgi:hypothetical protein